MEPGAPPADSSSLPEARSPSRGPTWPASAKAPSRPRGTRDVLLVLAFSNGWTWGFWILVGALGESVWDWPASLLFYVGGAGVFLGGWVMAFLVHGRVGLRELGVRIVDLNRPGFAGDPRV